VQQSVLATATDNWPIGEESSGHSNSNLQAAVEIGSSRMGSVGGHSSDSSGVRSFGGHSIGGSSGGGSNSSAIASSGSGVTSSSIGVASKQEW